MGFLRRLLGGAPPRASGAPANERVRRHEVEDRTTVVVLGPEDVFLAGYRGRIEAVGESFHREAIVEAVGGERPGGRAVLRTVQLVPETDNPHDRNAIAVRARGETIAQLPRDIALAARCSLAHPSA